MANEWIFLEVIKVKKETDEIILKKPKKLTFWWGRSSFDWSSIRKFKGQRQFRMTETRRPTL
jgi:hypothetical protein